MAKLDIPQLIKSYLSKRVICYEINDVQKEYIMTTGIPHGVLILLVPEEVMLIDFANGLSVITKHSKDVLFKWNHLCDQIMNDETGLSEEQKTDRALITNGRKNNTRFVRKIRAWMRVFSWFQVLLSLRRSADDNFAFGMLNNVLLGKIKFFRQIYGDSQDYGNKG